MTIIAMCGAKQCGKSTLSSYLTDHHGYERISFADPLYDMVSALAGVDARTLPKETPLDALGGKTLRYTLQTLGTEWGRDIMSESLWLDALANRILSAPEDSKFVIDDARFPNEFDLLSMLGATIVRIVRPDNADHGHLHVSEMGWQDIECDAHLTNDFGSADDFCGYAAASLAGR